MCSYGNSPEWRNRWGEDARARWSREWREAGLFSTPWLMRSERIAHFEQGGWQVSESWKGSQLDASPQTLRGPWARPIPNPNCGQCWGANTPAAIPRTGPDIRWLGQDRVRHQPWWSWRGCEAGQDAGLISPLCLWLSLSLDLPLFLIQGTQTGLLEQSSRWTLALGLKTNTTWSRRILAPTQQPKSTMSYSAFGQRRNLAKSKY